MTNVCQGVPLQPNEGAWLILTGSRGCLAGTQRNRDVYWDMRVSAADVTSFRIIARTT